jgi:XRE family transcriptional regulator, regulator of sulfur utilization
MLSLDRISNLLAQSVRAHRESRGLSLGSLAEKAGISKTSLSKIESGTGNPSLEVLCRIAQALNIPIGSLLGEDNRPALKVMRSGEGQIVQSDSGLLIRPLLIEGRNQRTEVYEMVVPPNVAYHSLAHSPGTEEFIVCLEGDLRLGPTGQEVPLRAGDAVWFPADLPHAYESVAGARAILLMRYPPALGIP